MREKNQLYLFVLTCEKWKRTALLIFENGDDDSDGDDDDINENYDEDDIDTIQT